MAKGIPASAIKDALVRQGYSPALVDGVVESVMMNNSRSAAPLTAGASQEKSAFPKIILVLVFLALVAVGIIFVPKMLTPKDALLDVKATADKLSYSPGEGLGFDVAISNMGSKDEFDVTLIYRILDRNDNTLLSQEETLAISTSMSHRRTIQLPATMKTGSYTLKVFANYADKVATSAFSFEVAKATVKLTCIDKVQNQDELGPDCDGVCGGYWYDNSCHSTPKAGDNTNTVTNVDETCNDDTMNQDEEGVDCGGVCGGYWYDNSCHATQKATTTTTTKVSFAETMMKASTAAKTNPDEAKALCLGLEAASEKDKCLKKIADVAGQSALCDLIVDVSDKDECYYPFFMKGDYSVCAKITDEQSKTSCENLKQIYEIKAQMESANGTV